MFSDIAPLWSLTKIPTDEGSPIVAHIVFPEAVSNWWFRNQLRTEKDKPVRSEDTNHHSRKMRPIEFSGHGPWEEEATQKGPRHFHRYPLESLPEAS